MDEWLPGLGAGGVEEDGWGPRADGNALCPDSVSVHIWAVMFTVELG